jgi:hypothetical protein
MTSSGRRRHLGTAGLAVVVLLAWLNGLGARWFAVSFQLFGETADRGDYLVGAGACAATAALLFVALLAMLTVRPPWWLMVATALGIGVQLAVSLTSYQRAQDFDVVAGGDTFVDGLRTAFFWPGSWPLLVVLVVIAVLAVRSRVRS